MNRHYFIVPVVLSLFVLAGCSGGNQQANIIDPFIGGNIALQAYWQNGAPPPQIYDGGKGPFAANVVIENVGESDIGPGTENPYMTVKLDGILPAEFGVTDADIKQTLQQRVNGAHKQFDGTILGGLINNFVFDRLNYQSDLVGNSQRTLRAVLCYDYSNTAQTQTCMKNDIIENVQDSTLCTLTGEKPVANSGGPVHVTHVVQNPLSSNKIQVNFQLEHLGFGEFYGRTGTEDCDPSVRNLNKFILDIEVKSGDPSAAVNCYRFSNSNHGTITMYNGAPTQLSCTVTSTGSNVRVHQDTLTIKTKYRYGQFIEQPIIVLAVPDN